MEKLKFAFYWAATCGGCDVATLDIEQKILDVVEIADIVLWPVAMDFKYKEVEAMGADSIDVCLFNGQVRNSEHEHIAKVLREKSKIMIAFGSCANRGYLNPNFNGYLWPTLRSDGLNGLQLQEYNY